MVGSSQDLTELLTEWSKGKQQAGNQLIEAVYDHLRRLASRYLRLESPGNLMDTTALVHELYMKLCSSGSVQWQDRGHFFAVAARQLRRILVDYARSERSEKRGGKFFRVSLSAASNLASPVTMDILEIDEALQELEALDRRAAAAIELRFFVGLKESEIAEALGISLVTLHRDWRTARAWLLSRLNWQPGMQK
jgi:RNA polymerase sigma factor (TIGR02999 family)